MQTLLKLLWKHMDSMEKPVKNIVLEAFQEIEKTPELLKQYNQVVEQSGGNRQSINSRISQEIGKHYGLTSTKVVNVTTLIKSYSERKK